VKNAFVLAPLIFSRELLEADHLLLSLRAFVGFCLLSGAVYSVNDMSDLELDRAHPEKRRRPLASGDLRPWEGWCAATVLMSGTILLSLGLGWRFHFVIGTYFLLNILYSLKLKEVVLLDVFVVASGFMLRVLAGAYAIDVPVSNWIVLCTMFISLLLGFAKRRGELALVGGQSDFRGRKVLLLYRAEFIDQMLTITAAGAVITYALYTVAPSTLAIFGTEKAIYTTVFVLFGVFRYLFLVHSGKATDNPSATITSDPPILLTGLLWIATCIVLIYLR
jgi:4-hydroxybenzoate polyprenyltransferase